jgi:hypothetical protein
MPNPLDLQKSPHVGLFSYALTKLVSVPLIAYD